MRSPLVATLLVVLLTFSTGAADTAAADCQFVLGFKTLHDMIPDVVGDCLENEHHNLTNGDALQRTVGGLLVWRKADNWTAFTDGYRTWINGPAGLQRRLNVERFPWEPDYVPVTDNPSPDDTRAYLLWVHDRLDTLDRVYFVASEHLLRLQNQPELMNDPQWRSEAGAIFQAMREIGKQMQTYRGGPLPRSFAPMHSLLVAIGQDIVYIADELSAAFDTMDFTRVANAIQTVDAAKVKLEQFIVEAEALQQQYDY